MLPWTRRARIRVRDRQVEMRRETRRGVSLLAHVIISTHPFPHAAGASSSTSPFVGLLSEFLVDLLEMGLLCRGPSCFRLECAPKRLRVQLVSSTCYWPDPSPLCLSVLQAGSSVAPCCARMETRRLDYGLRGIGWWEKQTDSMCQSLIIFSLPAGPAVS